MIAVADSGTAPVPAQAAQKGRHIARGALIAFLTAIVAGLALLVVARPFGVGTVLTHGVSMGDTVPNGSLAITRETSAASVHRGDIIVVTVGAAKVHRVAAIEQRDRQWVVQTRGDANDAPDPDPYVLPAHTARVVTVVPYAGYVVAFAMSPLGWLTLIAAPAAWLLFAFVKGVWVSEDAEAR
ncbi:MAG TPA: signal peptidase I [Acidimicrobiales bacterium]|nr:signal peptidase I [Acidimicrobiales bacterium]